MQDKWALEEHLSTAQNNEMWNSPGEAARNGKQYMDYIAELGVDRVMFSADYPYETMEEAAAWFDASLLSSNDEQKIGRENARRLFASIR